jgi:malate synthase
VRHNLRVGVQYLAAWLDGNGCVPLYHLMEDAATAEICRAQLWQWVRHGVRTAEGTPMLAWPLRRVLAEELDRIRLEVGAERYARGVFPPRRGCSGT